LTACKSNQKNIGTALEMYFTDHQERYPSALSALTPNYLRVIPICASAKKDTYSGAFVSTDSHYTVYCAGSHHFNPNFPQYNSTEGLVERPQ
jgi:uncharacterized protein YfbU (UPF0304 family)